MKTRCSICVALLGLVVPSSNAFQLSKRVHYKDSIPTTYLLEMVAFKSFCKSKLSASKEAAEDASTVVSSEVSTSSKGITSFTSPPTRLFIEDTDAYGVMYNANYIRSYERALHQFSYDYRQQNGYRNNDNVEEGGILSYSDFIMTQVTSHKFKASPMLGSEFVISAQKIDNTEPISKSDDENAALFGLSETWSLEMNEYNNKEEEEEEASELNVSSSKVYNTAVVTITRPPRVSPLYHQSSSLEKVKFDPSSRRIENTFQLQRDEFDSHSEGILPIQTVLKLFERSRTLGLGGPQILRQMQEENNILWVVTSVDDLKVNVGAKLESGQSVNVISRAEMKRNGMILEFQQMIEIPPNEAEAEAIVAARGVVTLFAIDRLKGRPTSKIPDLVRALLEEKTN